jgi:hypothetical protein
MKAQKPILFTPKEAIMLKRTLLILLGLALIVPSFISSQDQISAKRASRSGIKARNAYFIGERGMSTQAAKIDKTRAVLMGITVWGYFSSFEDWDLRYIFPKNDVDEIEIDVDFTAVLNTKVKFHLFFTGPEFLYYTDDKWYNAKYKSADYFEDNVYYQSFFTDEFKKGTYKLVVIAEQETPGSGAQTVAECIFKFI